MRNQTLSCGFLKLAVIASLLTAPVAVAHHGSAISYDMDHPWTTKAVVVEFRYQNPHPTLIFDRTNDKGETERWVTELITNPSLLLRAGWTKSRSDAALKPGTTVTVTVCTSRVGGTNGATLKILDQNGQEILRTLTDGQRGQGGGGEGSGSGNPPQPKRP